MSDYALIEPFECDDPMFCLGVEWAMFRQKLLGGEPFRDLVVTQNAERLIRMCERHGRFVETVACESASEWTQVVVGGVKTESEAGDEGSRN